MRELDASVERGLLFLKIYFSFFVEVFDEKEREKNPSSSSSVLKTPSFPPPSHLEDVFSFLDLHLRGLAVALERDPVFYLCEERGEKRTDKEKRDKARTRRERERRNGDDDAVKLKPRQRSNSHGIEQALTDSILPARRIVLHASVYAAK